MNKHLEHLKTRAKYFFLNISIFKVLALLIILNIAYHLATEALEEEVPVISDREPSVTVPLSD